LKFQTCIQVYIQIYFLILPLLNVLELLSNIISFAVVYHHDVFLKFLIRQVQIFGFKSTNLWRQTLELVEWRQLLSSFLFLWTVKEIRWPIGELLWFCKVIAIFIKGQLLDIFVNILIFVLIWSIFVSIKTHDTSGRYSSALLLSLYS